MPETTTLRILIDCPAPKGHGLYRPGEIVEAPTEHAEILARKGAATALDTKAALYDVAKEMGLRGRSDMNKAELHDAVIEAAPTQR